LIYLLIRDQEVGGLNALARPIHRDELFLLFLEFLSF